MAGDWIKLRSNLWDDPRIARVCDLLDCTEASVIGGLYWLWATADQHTETGVMPGLTLRQVDRKTGIPGFGQALCDIGWLADHPDGVRISRFEEHNGASAKRRCSDAQRKANSRSVSADEADTTRTDAGQNTDEMRRIAELEKEKRREEKNNDIEPSALVDEAAPPRPSPCPTDRIIALYHEHLPMLSRVEVVNDARRRSISARWREVISDPDIRKAQDPREAALEFFAWFFGHVATSTFLTGKSKDWRADIDFLMTPTKFARVVEGNYHKEHA
jgi:hypothetical protein